MRKYRIASVTDVLLLIFVARSETVMDSLSSVIDMVAIRLPLSPNKIVLRVCLGETDDGLAGCNIRHSISHCL